MLGDVAQARERDRPGHCELSDACGVPGAAPVFELRDRARLAITVSRKSLARSSSD